MVNSFIIAGALTFGQPVGQSLPDNDATKYIVKAMYYELEWDKIVTRVEKKHLKLDKYPELTYIGIVARIVTEKRVTYTWRF